ncbi:ARHGEF12, partial [Cordylochernes scorpioides]
MSAGLQQRRAQFAQKKRENRPSFRKRSDPNIPRSKSRSLDSPSNSVETTTTTTRDFEDSDLEAEVDPPDWQKLLDWEVLRLLKPKEKKRQDVINELFHTERTHVKNLKVLDKLFYRPLVQSPELLPVDLLSLLFPNLDQMISIHSAFNSAMKSRRKQEALIGNVGPMMLHMLDGTSGEELKEAAAIFCSNQSIALEMLKQRQKKDQKVGQFLSDAEAHPLCRRLQLKDIIATGFQRLTKYPLLLENIAKHTTPNTEEHSQLLQALESSRNILAHVNQAVKETENMHRLAELQRKVDKSSLDKQYKVVPHKETTLDLTKHRMLYEGGLTWRLNKQKSLEVHVVLLEEILLLFQRQDDKLVLRNHNSSITADTKVAYHPVLHVQNIFTRNVAV